SMIRRWTSCGWPNRSGCARSASRRRATSPRRSGVPLRARVRPSSTSRSTGASRISSAFQVRIYRRNSSRHDGSLRMRVAYFDCPSGASGDMVLGALVDAGYPLETLEAALARLGVEGWRLEARPVERGGLRGTHLQVRTDPARRFHDLGDMLRPIERSTLPH